MFTISVCMIVKNEEDCLGRILSCAKKFADEIIVVDTGSTDASKEIAKKFTSKVFDFEWCDDFSKARNYAFSFATCDFQMWLDADDFITDENIQKIVALKNGSATEAPDVFMCKYAIGFNQQNQPTMVYNRERILKRSENFKWEGFVHEAIVPHGKIVYTDIEIQHRKTHAGNPKRNLRLYQKAIKAGHALTPRELYYYARELFYNGHFRKAAQTFAKFIKIPNTFPPDNLGAHLMLSDCHKQLGQTKKAADVLLSYLKTNVPNAEFCCQLGYLYDFMSSPDSAIFWFKCAPLCPKQTQGFVREECQEFLPYLELSRLLFKKDFPLAKQFHEKAKLLQPNHPSVLFNEQFFK